MIYTWVCLKMLVSRIPQKESGKMMSNQCYPILKQELGSTKKLQ